MESQFLCFEGIGMDGVLMHSQSTLGPLNLSVCLGCSLVLCCLKPSLDLEIFPQIWVMLLSM